MTKINEPKNRTKKRKHEKPNILNTPSPNQPSKKTRLRRIRISKKALMVTTAALIILAFAVIGIVSCSRATYFQLALDNLAEARFYSKQDETEKLKIQFFTGMRENPYSMNGVSETTVPFGIVNLEPKDDVLVNVNVPISGTLKIGDEAPIHIELERNPTGRNFACDINRLVDKKHALVVTLTIGEETIVFNPKNGMHDQAISWEKALEISTKHFEKKIKKAGEFECYVKILPSPVKGTDDFWYVQFIPKSGKTFYCVIDVDGKVIGA